MTQNIILFFVQFVEIERTRRVYLKYLEEQTKIEMLNMNLDKGFSSSKIDWAI